MAEIPIPENYISELEGFITLCKENPSLLHHPDLSFFKAFIESLGGKIPTENADYSKSFSKAPEPESVPPEPMEEEDESEESDVELDLSGVIEPDKGEPQFMGDTDKQVTEDDCEKSDEMRREAVIAASEGDYEKAVEIYTNAIRLNPGSAVLFVKRGQCFLNLEKPNACVRDCTRALEINPDSASAFKFRGRANRLLGRWEEAASDLRSACKIDFDEQADEWLREVTPNARKLEEHRRKYERKRAEKELKEKLERARRAREEHARAAKEAGSKVGESDDNESPFGSGMGDFYKLFNDPEIKQAFEDPEIAAAVQDISMNPSNIFKHKDNPKVAAVLSKLASKFGGGAGFPPGGFPAGGFPAGGFPPGGFPPPPSGFAPGSGFPPSGGAPGAGTNSDDVGLD